MSYLFCSIQVFPECTKCTDRYTHNARRAGVLVTVYTANISLSLGTVGQRWYTTGRIGLQAMCNVNLNESYSLDSRFSLENYLFHDGSIHCLSLPTPWPKTGQWPHNSVSNRLCHETVAPDCNYTIQFASLLRPRKTPTPVIY